MVEVTDEELAAAEKRGRVLFETVPHAKAVRHDLKSGMTVVELYDGCSFAFPPRRLQGLEQASDAELLAVEINGLGYGLHWEALDADFTVRGLMAGRFGSESHMVLERARLPAILDEIGANPRPHAA